MKQQQQQKRLNSNEYQLVDIFNSHSLPILDDIYDDDSFNPKKGCNIMKRECICLCFKIRIDHSNQL